MPSPRRLKKSVSKGPKKSAKKSVRKGPKKSAKKSVRKSTKKVLRKSAKKNVKRSYRMDPPGSGASADMENVYNERLNYLRSIPKPERQRAISKMLEAKHNPNPYEMHLEKRLLRQLTEDAQQE